MKVSDLIENLKKLDPEIYISGNISLNPPAETPLDKAFKSHLLFEDETYETEYGRINKYKIKQWFREL